MARAKLTLSVDRDVIARAKRVARRHGTSLPSMFARFLTFVAKEEAAPAVHAPLTRQALGLVRLPAGKSDKQLLADALAGRYGR